MTHPEHFHKLDSKFWKIVFLVAGLYTAGGVLPGVIDPTQGVLDFTGQGSDGFYTAFFFRSLWLTVMVFGIGYLIVATKPSKYPGIVVMGMVGKLLFAINVVYHFSTGDLSNMALTAALVDFIFVGLFAAFIYFHRMTD